jgi:hypothetical protein
MDVLMVAGNVGEVVYPLSGDQKPVTWWVGLPDLGPLSLDDVAESDGRGSFGPFGRATCGSELQLRR